MKAISQHLRRRMSLYKTIGGTYTVKMNYFEGWKVVKNRTSSDTHGEIPNLEENIKALEYETED